MSEIAGDLRDAIIEYQVSLGSPSARWIFRSGAAQFSQQVSLYDQNLQLIVRPWLFFVKVD